MTRILLVYPPTTINLQNERKEYHSKRYFSLAAVLLNEGYDVRILDATFEDFNHEEKIQESIIRFGMSYERIKQAITSYQPHIVGVSSLFTSQATNAHAICRLAKEVSHEILTVMGGAYPTSETERCLSDTNVDYVITGEGESAVLNLLRDYKKLPKGIISAPLIEDINSLPFPASHLINFTSYSMVTCAHGVIKQKPFASIFSSRGCPFNCSFCFSDRMYGRKFRGPQS